MEKLASLDFTTPNNAALSLRCLAEWVRTKEVMMDHPPEGVTILNLRFFEPKMGGR